MAISYQYDLFLLLYVLLNFNCICRALDVGYSWTEVSHGVWTPRCGLATAVDYFGHILLMGGYYSHTSNYNYNYNRPAYLGPPEVNQTFFNDVWKSVDQGYTWTQLTTSAA